MCSYTYSLKILPAHRLLSVLMLTTNAVNKHATEDRMRGIARSVAYQGSVFFVVDDENNSTQLHVYGRRSLHCCKISLKYIEARTEYQSVKLSSNNSIHNHVQCPFVSLRSYQSRRLFLFFLLTHAASA